MDSNVKMDDEKLEQYYIDVRDLSNLIHANHILREICIKSQPNIDEKEFKDIVEKITIWQSRMFSVIEKYRDYLWI